MSLTMYQCEREGLVLGDGTNYDIIGITGTGMPDVRDIDVNRLDDDGAWKTRQENVGKRILTLNLWVLARPGLPADELISDLKRAFQKDNDPKPFRFHWPLGFDLGSTGNDVRRVDAYVRGRIESLEHQNNTGAFPVIVEMACIDPRVYEDELRSFTVATAVDNVGREYPRVYPLTYQEGFSGIVVANNVGNFNTRPTARIDGPCTSPRIENVTTGQLLRLRTELLEDQFLEIDFDARSILLNGTANRYGDKVISSTFFDVIPGENSIRFAAEAFQEGAQLTFRWRSAWL